MQNIQKDFAEDVLEALQVVGRAHGETSENYQDAIKLINAKNCKLRIEFTYRNRYGKS